LIRAIVPFHNSILSIEFKADLLAEVAALPARTAFQGGD